MVSILKSVASWISFSCRRYCHKPTNIPCFHRWSLVWSLDTDYPCQTRPKSHTYWADWYHLTCWSSYNYCCCSPISPRIPPRQFWFDLKWVRPWHSFLGVLQSRVFQTEQKECCPSSTGTWASREVAVLCIYSGRLRECRTVFYRQICTDNWAQWFLWVQSLCSFL